MNGTKICVVDGCDRPFHCRGYCRKHYSRVQRTGDAGPAGARPVAHLEECSVQGCFGIVGIKGARGYCTKHYQMFLKTGDPCGTTAPPVEDRFFAKVEPSGICWDWTAAKDEDGYGLFITDTSTRSHRWAYEFLVGPIPEGMELDHLCRNRGCCNPDHLEPVEPIENWRRGFSLQAINSRKAECKHGHPFDQFNTYRRPNGGRVCRTCTAVSRRKYERKMAA